MTGSPLNSVAKQTFPQNLEAWSNLTISNQCNYTYTHHIWGLTAEVYELVILQQNYLKYKLRSVALVHLKSTSSLLHLLDTRYIDNFFFIVDNLVLKMKANNHQVLYKHSSLSGLIETNTNTSAKIICHSYPWSVFCKFLIDSSSEPPQLFITAYEGSPYLCFGTYQQVTRGLHWHPAGYWC